MRRLTTLVAALVLALLPGCSKTPTTPTSDAPSGPRSGTWIGTLADTSNGQGALRVVLQETPFGSGQGVLSGTWSTTFADGSKNAVGDAVGSLMGAVVQLNLQRTAPSSCPPPVPPFAFPGSYFALNLTLSGTTISGTYDYHTCATPVRGTLTITKQ